jgi:hypothetical protein
MTGELIALIFLPVAAYLFFRVWKKRAATPPAAVGGEPKVPIFERERNIALNVNPTLLKLQIPDDEILVYGVVLDLDMGEGFMTLACYITGAANLLFSSGGGIRGGGKNPAIGEAGVAFVTSAQEYLIFAKPVVAPLPPAKGHAQFFLLTNKGKFTACEPLRSLEDNSSVWLALFEAGSGVIKEMHRTSVPQNPA